MRIWHYETSMMELVAKLVNSLYKYLHHRCLTGSNMPLIRPFRILRDVSKRSRLFITFLIFWFIFFHLMPTVYLVYTNVLSKLLLSLRQRKYILLHLFRLVMVEKLLPLLFPLCIFKTSMWGSKATVFTPKIKRLSHSKWLKATVMQIL